MRNYPFALFYTIARNIYCFQQYNVIKLYLKQYRDMQRLLNGWFVQNVSNVLAVTQWFKF